MKRIFIVISLLLISGILYSQTTITVPVRYDTVIVGQATASWRAIDLNANRTVYGWFSNDASATSDSLYLAYGLTSRIDTANTLRVTLLPGEIMNIQLRIMRYLYFKRAGSNNVNVRGVLTR